MFKKAIVALIACAFSSSVFAAGYGAAGCGLGSMVLGDKEGFVQVFAATTNGTSGSQTFGITSGTSNCASGGKSAAAFIEANRAALKNDVARGEGETINALAEIYGVKNVGEMSKTLKNSYADIFAATDAAVIETSIRKRLEARKLL